MTQNLDTNIAIPALPQRRDYASGSALIAGAAFRLLHPLAPHAREHRRVLAVLTFLRA